MKKEKRWLAFTEVRATKGPGGELKVGGYAAVFNKLSEVLWNFREKIAPGAFAKSLRENDIIALWSHKTDQPLGRSGNGTLTLTEDKKGLKFELDLPDSPAGQNAYVSIERGDVDGMSFGFTVREENWKRGKGEKPHERTILDADLIEISPTAFPAYKQTKVGTRDTEQPQALVDQEERWANEDREQEKTIETPGKPINTGMSTNRARLRLAESE